MYVYSDYYKSVHKQYIQRATINQMLLMIKRFRLNREFYAALTHFRSTVQAGRDFVTESEEEDCRAADDLHFSVVQK